MLRHNGLILPIFPFRILTFLADEIFSAGSRPDPWPPLR